MCAKSRSTVFSIFLLAAAVLSLFTGVPQGNAQLAAPPGVTDLANGFPAFYTDANGVNLAPCLDVFDAAAAFQGCAPFVAEPGIFNPALPVVFPTNFPSAFDYWAADADFRAVDTARHVRAITFSLGGGFGGGVPLAGDQVVNHTVRFRVDGLLPASTLTITHPFGADLTGTADARGSVDVTTTFPANPAPLGFAAVIPGPFVNEFLQFPAPPNPAYIGDFAASVPVAGQTATVSGTDSAGAALNLTTTNWFVAGKLFVFSAHQPTATFSRSATGAGTVHVAAVSAPAATTVNVSGVVTALPGEPVALTQNTTTGAWAADISILAATSLPAQVSIIAAAPPLPAGPAQNIPMTDIVTITTPVDFDVPTRTLTVTAHSSNLFPPVPVLTVTNQAGAPLGTIPATGVLTVAVPATAADPTSVTVTSTPAVGATAPAGGKATAAVTAVGAVVPPGGGPAAPGAGAVPVGAGGGGGGGCFVDSLF